MPILNVKVAAVKSPALTESISRTLLELTSRVLHKDPRITAIAIDYIDPQDWLVGGKSLAALGMSSVYFDIKVVDETNTKSEKAQYLKEAFEALRKILGNLHEESYIYIQDVRPTAYGYGGFTQEYRYQHPPAESR